MIRAPEPDRPAPGPAPVATVRLRHRIGENRGVRSGVWGRRHLRGRREPGLRPLGMARAAFLAVALPGLVLALLALRLCDYRSIRLDGRLLSQHWSLGRRIACAAGTGWNARQDQDIGGGVRRARQPLIWHLLSDPQARYRDLGPEFYDNRTGPTARSATAFGNSKSSATRSCLHGRRRSPGARPGRRRTRRRRRGRRGRPRLAPAAPTSSSTSPARCAIGSGLPARKSPSTCTTPTTGRATSGSATSRATAGTSAPTAARPARPDPHRLRRGGALVAEVTASARRPRALRGRVTLEPAAWPPFARRAAVRVGQAVVRCTVSGWFSDEYAASTRRSVFSTSTDSTTSAHSMTTDAATVHSSRRGDLRVGRGRHGGRPRHGGGHHATV